MNTLMLIFLLAIGAPMMGTQEGPRYSLDAKKSEIFLPNRTALWARIFEIQGYKLETIISHPETRAMVACHDYAINQNIKNYSLKTLGNYNLAFGRRDQALYVSFSAKIPSARQFLDESFVHYRTFHCTYDLTSESVVKFELDH